MWIHFSSQYFINWYILWERKIIHKLVIRLIFILHTWKTRWKFIMYFQKRFLKNQLRNRPNIHYIATIKTSMVFPHSLNKTEISWLWNSTETWIEERTRQIYSHRQKPVYNPPTYWEHFMNPLLVFNSYWKNLIKILVFQKKIFLTKMKWLQQKQPWRISSFL